ncbi:MFS transporter [candidate division KSB1 bacterium]|nr:MFS transporter [candidate division KSB1 bacterium]
MKAKIVMQAVYISTVQALFYTGVAAWWPFFNLYLKDMGFSGTQIGVIAGVYQAMLFLVVPFWGFIADRKGNLQVLKVTLLISILFVFGIRFMFSFYFILFYMVIMAFFHHPIGVIIDTVAIRHVNYYQRHSFGFFRLWASFGWMTGTILMGRYLTHFPGNHIFPAAAIIYSITILFTLWLKPVPTPLQSHITIREVRFIFGEKKVLLFFVLLLLCGIGIAPIYVFINLYFRALGAGKQLIGLAFAIHALTEIPFFFIGKRIVRRYGSNKILLLAIGVALLRMFLYSFVTNPVVALLIGLGQGLSFSLFWVAAVDYLHELIPPQWGTTTQSLLWACHLGAGVTLGNVLIGRLSDLISMQKVMMFGGIYLVFIWIAFLGYFYYRPRSMTS